MQSRAVASAGKHGIEGLDGPGSETWRTPLLGLSFCCRAKELGLGRARPGQAAVLIGMCVGWAWGQAGLDQALAPTGT